MHKNEITTGLTIFKTMCFSTFWDTKARNLASTFWSTAGPLPVLLVLREFTTNPHKVPLLFNTKIGIKVKNALLEFEIFEDKDCIFMVSFIIYTASNTVSDPYQMFYENLLWINALKSKLSPRLISLHNNNKRWFSLFVLGRYYDIISISEMIKLKYRQVN